MKDFNKRFYVYLHIVNKEFRLNDVEYNIGDVVYVGAGQRSRYKMIDDSRSKDHISVWDNLEKVKIVENLTEEEKFNIEKEYIDKYISTGKLFNIRRQHNYTQEVKFEVMDFFFRIDEDSKSNLSWKNHKNNSKIERLSGSYYSVTLAGRTYQVSRIVWSLANKADCPTNMVVDHINGNRSDNSITNLRLATYSENVINRNKTSTKNIGVRLKIVSGIRYVVINISRNESSYRLLINIRKSFPDFDRESAESLAFNAAIKTRNSIKEMLESGQKLSYNSAKELLDSVITSVNLTHLKGNTLCQSTN